MTRTEAGPIGLKLPSFSDLAMPFGDGHFRPFRGSCGPQDCTPDGGPVVMRNSVMRPGTGCCSGSNPSFAALVAAPASEGNRQQDSECPVS